MSTTKNSTNKITSWSQGEFPPKQDIAWYLYCKMSLFTSVRTPSPVTRFMMFPSHFNDSFGKIHWPDTCQVSQVSNNTGTPRDSIWFHFEAWSHRPPCQATGLCSFLANLIATQVDVCKRLGDFQCFGKGLWTKTMATNSWTQPTTLALIGRKRGLKTRFQSHSEPSKGNKWACAFDLINLQLVEPRPRTWICITTVWWPKQRERCHDTKGSHMQGTICELARDFPESITTDNTALTMKRALAGSLASCSSSLSTLLFANACCNPTVHHSFVLQRCVLPEEKKNSSNINYHQPISGLTQSFGLCFATSEVGNLKPLAVEAGRHQSAHKHAQGANCAITKEGLRPSWSYHCDKSGISPTTCISLK